MTADTADLVVFLRARLDEDQQAAEAAAWCDDGAKWSVWRGKERYENPFVITDALDTGITAVRSESADTESVAEHMARWDPERVLADIDAKRQLIELHQEKQEQGYSSDFCAECGFGETSQEYYPCATLRLLALPYADRPGYREDWRP